MHQDSQNFLDITVIDPTKKLTVDLKIIIHGNIVYEVFLNNETVISPYSTILLDLFDDIELKVNVLENKNNGAIEIKKLEVNKKEILPLYQHLASEKTCWITQGEWNYFISSPFYTWYHNASGQGWIA